MFCESKTATAAGSAVCSKGYIELRYSIKGPASGLRYIDSCEGPAAPAFLWADSHPRTAPCIARAHLRPGDDERAGAPRIPHWAGNPLSAAARDGARPGAAIAPGCARGTRAQAVQDHARWKKGSRQGAGEGRRVAPRASRGAPTAHLMLIAVGRRSRQESKRNYSRSSARWRPHRKCRCPPPPERPISGALGALSWPKLSWPKLLGALYEYLGVRYFGAFSPPKPRKPPDSLRAKLFP